MWKPDSLKKELNPSCADAIIEFQDWVQNFRASDAGKTTDIKEALTQEAWDNWLLHVPSKPKSVSPKSDPDDAEDSLDKKLEAGFSRFLMSG